MTLRWSVVGLVGAVGAVGVLLGLGVVSTTLLLVVFLTVAVPAIAFGQVALLEEAQPTRLGIYLSSMFSILVMGGLALLDGFRTFGLTTMGLGSMRLLPDLSLGVALGLLGIVVVFAFEVATQRGFGTRDSDLLHRMLPETALERGVFFGLSIVAGVGEEIAYRGFLLTAIEVWSGSGVLALVVSSAAFGSVHAYQGKSGVVRAATLGLLLGWSFVLTGSLLPAIIAHTMIDWIMGLWLGRRILGETRLAIDPPA